MKRKHVQKIDQILQTLVQEGTMIILTWISSGSMAADVAQSTDLPVNYTGSVLKKNTE